MTHINSIFNFFLLFAGLVLNAIAIVIQKGLHNSTSADEIFAVFGSVISLVFLGLDGRTRAIMLHIEGSMEILENEVLGDENAYL